MVNINTLKAICIFVFLFGFNHASLAQETVFYALRYSSPDRMSSPADTLNSLKKHYKKIDVLVPQAYVVDEAGNVSKEIEPAIFDFAVKHKMKVMPLVTNVGFNKDKAHQFLLDTNAQEKAIAALVTLCQKHHFYGVQLDFEMINIKDRGALTRFYVLAANALHKTGLIISFALAPLVTDKPDSFFLKKIYENWEGAYDFKKIGAVADFVSIMTYNQHGGRTTPGPTANLPWTEQTIIYALQSVPANKISLGIPAYSTHWYTGTCKVEGSEKICLKMRALNYQAARDVLKQNNARLK